MLERPLRALSIVVATFLAIAFIVFAVNQGDSASVTQQRKIDGSSALLHPAPAHPHRSGLHRAIDRGDHVLLAPFNGVAAGADSAWIQRGVASLLALLVYGVGLASLARYSHGRA